MSRIPDNHPAIQAIATALALRCLQNSRCEATRHMGDARAVLLALNSAGYNIVRTA